MKLTTILIGGAALVGLGLYLSKKLGSKDEEDEDVVVVAGEKETYSEKLHKASMFAVGAIKTSADKIVEGINDIRRQDMVKKGEQTVCDVKESAGNFVGELKDKVAGRAQVVMAEEDDIADGSDDYFMAESAEDDFE
ncbi:MAG: hypothetical protein LBC86_10635 [Oscillospiraceae bacterium]|jgi:hypothetical protein|nr:hypothetical protein [Oscillospiraceae bacterium]